MTSPDSGPGLSRRRFLRTTVGATGAALAGWRWVSLVAATATEGPIASLSAPVLGGLGGASAFAAVPAFAAAPSVLARAQSAGAIAFLEFPSPAKTASGPLAVVGESQDPVHPQTIEVLAAALGAEDLQSVGAPAGGANTKFTALKFTKAVDLASPALFRLLAEGASLPDAKLYIRQPGGSVDYVVYQFGLLYVTSIDASALVGADEPQDQVQLMFGSMEVTYIPNADSDSPGAPLTADWSQVLNAPTLDVN